MTDPTQEEKNQKAHELLLKGMAVSHALQAMGCDGDEMLKILGAALFALAEQANAHEAIATLLESLAVRIRASNDGMGTPASEYVQ